MLLEDKVLGKAESDELRSFARRFSATLADGTHPVGYFRIEGGRNSKVARQVTASVHWRSDIAALEEELLERVSDAVEENLFVWVRAIPHGETKPAKSVKLDGNAELLDDDEDAKRPKGPHADKEALAMVALGQMRLIDHQNDRIDRLWQEKVESMVGFGVLKDREGALMLGGTQDQLVQMVAGQLGPELIKQLPTALAILANWQNGHPVVMPSAVEEVPEEAAAAVPFWVGRIEVAVGGLKGLGPTIKASTDLQGQVLPHLLKLKGLVVEAAAFLGLQVVQAPPPSSPPPQDPEAK